MQLMETIGFGLVVIGTLRILDIVWPSQYLPWGFYAAEVVIGFGLQLAARNA